MGILTGGGDCGGLNGVIKGAALMAINQGLKSYIIPHGYAGLYNLLDFDAIPELTEHRIDQIDANLAGSDAGHSRVRIHSITNPDKYNRIKAGLQKFGIDGLVISGGDDTGSVMVDLAEHGIPCVHAPKTMDLDLQSYSVGFDSTVNRIATFLEDLKTTGETHNRILILEVFGRYAGHTAFRSAVAADADAALIPEIPTNFDVVFAHCKARYFNRISHSDTKSGAYLVVVAEGLKDVSGKALVDEAAAPDAFGHQRLAGAGPYVAQELTRRFKGDPDIPTLMRREKLYVEGIQEIPEIRTVIPGHLVRCGRSSVYDVNFGKEVGAAAVILLTSGLSGVTVTGLRQGKIEYIPTAEAIKQRYVDLHTVALYERLGLCFGRVAADATFSFAQKQDAIERFL